jgi:uncharacterized membrane protein YqjE
MEPLNETSSDWGPILKRFSRRLLALGENRLELLTVEVQEGRDRLIQDFLLALAVAGFGMIAVLAGSAALLVLFWNSYALVVLLGLMTVYGAVGVGLFLHLNRRLRAGQALSASLDQLRKDRHCLDQLIP